MRSVPLLILGMVLLVLGAQGGIRLLSDHENAGILGWLPGGFGVQLACYVVLVVVGAALARTYSANRRRS